MGLIIKILRPVIWLLCRVAFGVRFEGVQNVPDSGACIIAPNHLTFADPIWITIPIDRRVYYMAWDKPFEIPVLGFLMRSFGAFPVRLETTDHSAQRSAIEALANGHALVIFPEGGRSRTGEIMRFKMGAFRLALVNGVPIVPVTLSQGAYRIWPVGKWFPRPGELTITYHPLIDVPRVSEDISKRELRELSRDLADRTRRAIARGIESPLLSEDEDQAAAY